MSIIVRRRTTFPLPLPLTLFAATGRGLEDLLREEVATLLPGVEPVRRPGGVSVQTGLAGMCHLLLHLRSATRLLIRLGSFPATDQGTLYQGVRELFPWETIAPPGVTLAVSVTTRRSVITHSHHAALVVKDAVVDRVRDRCGIRPDVDTADPDLPLHLHLEGGEGILYLDPSGVSLDHRGYRQTGGEAPIREHLAAALILWSGWRGETPLYDPFCGTGTILVEGAMIASRIPAGMIRREPVILRHRWFPRREWEESLVRGREGVVPCRVPIVGSDLSASAVATARRISGALPFGRDLMFREEDARSFSPREGPGTIVTNPPYGRRIGGEGTASLLRLFGDRLKRHASGCRAFVVVPHGPLVGVIGLRPWRRIPFMNGPVDCRLLCFDLFEGGMRRRLASDEPSATVFNQSTMLEEVNDG